MRSETVAVGCHGATFSPVGDWIVTGSEDRTASVFRSDVYRDLLDPVVNRETRR
jgi:WD40 repeat protein